MTRSLRQRLGAGGSLVGCFVMLPAPAIVDMIAYAGFDFAVHADRARAGGAAHIRRKPMIPRNTSMLKQTLPAALLAVLVAWSVPGLAETYRLGVSEPLSGPASSLGIPVVAGVRLAVQQINAAGGVDGHRLELDIRDDQSKPDVAVQNARQLSEDGVYGMIGPNQGSNTLAIAPIVQRANMPICAFNNTISITRSGNRAIFRCQTSDSDNVKAALIFARATLHARTIGVIYTSDAYGGDAYDELRKQAPAMHLSIVAAEKIDYTSSDTTAEWTRLLASRPDVVVLWGSGSVMSVTLRNAAQLGNQAPIIAAQGAAAAAIIKGAGAAADGVYLLALNAPDVVTPEQEELSRLHRATGGAGYQLSIYDLIGWDAVHIFAEAMHRAGGDRGKMIDALESMHDFKGAAGTYSFSKGDHRGLGADSVWIVQVKNGEMHGVQHGLAAGD